MLPCSTDLLILPPVPVRLPNPAPLGFFSHPYSLSPPGNPLRLPPLWPRHLGTHSACLPCGPSTSAPTPPASPAAPAPRLSLAARASIRGTHSACLPCGPGTSSLPGSTCLYSAPTPPASPAAPAPRPSQAAQLALLMNPQVMLEEWHMREQLCPAFIPVSAPPSLLCCAQVNPQVNPQVMLDEQHRGSHSLGDRVSLFPLFPLSDPPNATDPLAQRPDPILARRGLVMVLEGERCPFSMQGGGGEQSRWGMGGDAEKGKGKGKGKGEGGEEKYGRLTITFICDPNAGEGGGGGGCVRVTGGRVAMPPWEKRERIICIAYSSANQASNLPFCPTLASSFPLLAAPNLLSSLPLPGIGHPSVWTEEGRRAAFNASLPFPAWTKR
ncbi:unnamed protein product [Closterium sp. Naga37s-1]|nr:unnamed protein product [Closterium sp. Naga37s-1]